MELQLLKLICYSFGSAIILLFIFVATLAVFFVKHIIEERKEDKIF